MTVTSTTNKNTYTGTGAVDTYAYSFRIFINTDLKVIVADTNGNETTLTLTTDYTVTGVGELTGGNVVLVNSSQDWLDGDGDLLTGYTLSIRRVRPLKQETDIRNQGSFYPETHEDEFDSQVMIDQQQQEEIDRSMKIAVTESGVNTALPSASADAYIGWNADADALVNKIPTSLDDSGPVINSGDAAKIVNVNSAEDAFQLSTFKALLEAITSGGLTFNTTTTFVQALTMSSIFKFKKGSDVASAGALTLGDDGNYFDITGTTDITSITAKTVGTVVKLQFDGILTVTDGSNLSIHGNFTTAAGRTMVLICDGTNWIELSRSPASFFDVGTFTRDKTVASGTQAVTGLGFKPKSVAFIAVEDGADEMCVGFDDNSGNACVFTNDGASANTWASAANVSLYLATDGSNYYRGEITTFDSDGFTYNWSKTGTPSGTISIHYLALG